MKITIAEQRVSKFLNNIVTQFHYEFKKRDDAYFLDNNGVNCIIQYEKKKKLLSRVCHFVIKIEKTTTMENLEKKEAFYDFRKSLWYGKNNDQFNKICNQIFQNKNWKLLDFEKISIQWIQNKFIFEMKLLPGSFTSLVFPPLSQGIPIYESEILILENIIKEISKRLISIESTMERGHDYV
jgi:hypothetical protein